MRIYTGVTIDTEFENLRVLGYSGTINDKQFAALRAEGLANALPDMFKQFDGSLVGGGTAPVITGTPLLTDNAIDVTGTLPMTFHYTNTASATPPSAGTIKAAPDSRSIVSGANSLTGLTQETTPGTWYFHYLIANSAGDSAIQTESYVVSAAGLSYEGKGATASANNATSFSLGLHTHLENDLLLLIIQNQDSKAVNAISGWTQHDGTDFGADITLFSKVAGPSETTPITVTFASAGYYTGVCAVFRNAAVGNVAASGGSGTTRTTPTLTATAGSTVLHLWAGNAVAPWVLTSPNAGDVIHDADAPLGQFQIIVEMQENVAGGTTTGRTATSDKSTTWSSMQFEILEV